ncbi:MAG: electron transfer flavoprotein subunit alpha/FixB family protein [Gammaproteobacteria bacterium]|nr:electron transfer flavoprotein subunit alpha/FixB family protein [Gammaproteobacteria bacterium]
MSKILVIAEHDSKTLNASTAKCVSCAGTFSGLEIDVAVFSTNGESLCTEAAKLQGIRKVLRVDAPVNGDPLAAVLAPQVAELAGEYTHVLGPSTTFGKDLMPRVAALLGVNQVSDIMEVLGNHEFRRPIYAGNAVLTVKADDNRKLVATVRTASYKACDTTGEASTESVSPQCEIPTHTRYVELKAQASDRPDLQTASRVVSGGRALGSAESFELIYDFADSIGAGVGASRAAVDAGYVPNDMQVGQTGKIIAPDIYFAFGISGAIQHLTGIKDAGTIVAVNKDAEAPIFEVADIGIVGDLFEVIPALKAKLAT